MPQKQCSHTKSTKSVNNWAIRYVCTVRIRYKDKIAKYRFFVVPGESPALLGMSHSEVLGILKIMCEVIGETQKQDVWLWNNAGSQWSSYRANNVHQIKAEKMDTNDTTLYMQDYFRSSTNRVVDIRASQAQTKKTHNEFSNVFQELVVLMACLVYRSRMTVSHNRNPLEGSICAPGNPKRRARKATKMVQQLCASS